MSGLNRRQNFVYIVLPTAVRLTLPSIINEVTMAIKASSLISVVGIAELTRVSQNLASSTFQPLEVYLTAGAIYLSISMIVAVISRNAERHLNLGER